MILQKDDEDEKPTPVPDPFPNIPHRNINCNLAGLTFSQVNILTVLG